ncbi:MAG: phage tail sheath subtilisin-like domain-containing protein [Spirochaetales bacterium]|nr:phage tail sheath subtilisin-like domain-containing protein [Spirochaetales bacterium]
MGALPGIEFRKTQSRSNKIALKENPVAGFVGVTEKGPLHEAVKVTDFNQFLRTFGGFETLGYLPFSVYSFFQNGGKQCYIVRTARTKGEGAAARAEFVLTSRGKSSARLTAKSEGTWGNHIRINLWHVPASREDKTLRVNVSLNCGSRQEDFLGLSADPRDEDFYLKRIQEKSVLVDAEHLSGKKGYELPDELYNSCFFEGREGIAALTAGDFIGSSASPLNKTGLALLENYQEINLLAIPDTALLENEKDRLSVHRALIDHSENIDGRFSLIDLPGSLDPQEAVAYRNKLCTSKAALYYPDLAVIDPADQSVFSLPPSCAMAGIISETDLKHGCYYPPGNRFIEGAVALSRQLLKEETAWLYENGINSFVKVPGKGIKVWGVRTLADDPNWRFINVRRTVSFLSAAIRKGTAWAVFEPNVLALRKRVVRHVTAYLIDVWRKGYLSGKTADEAFYIRCDDELNPPENVDAGILTVEVGLCVVKPAEYIVVTLHAEKEHTKVIIDEEVVNG